MSDTTATADTTPDAPAQEQPKPEATEVDWKVEARKWEQRAKENKTAAERLAEIEEANKTEAQKAADRLAAAEKKAVQAEARALRRDIALEHSLSKEDADLLDGMTDEAAMRKLAGRLAARESDRKKQGPVVPKEGASTKPKADIDREFLRAVTGQG